MKDFFDMRRFKKILFGTFVFAAAFCVSGETSGNTAVICTEKGNPATIILPKKCSKNTEYAAKELQNYLKMITTSRYPIQHNAELSSWKPTIFVLGTKDCPIIKQYLAPGSYPEKTVKKLKDDGYCVISRSGNKLLIIGNAGKHIGFLAGAYRTIQNINVSLVCQFV